MLVNGVRNRFQGIPLMVLLALEKFLIPILLVPKSFFIPSPDNKEVLYYHARVLVLRPIYTMTKLLFLRRLNPEEGPNIRSVEV